jgi:hypothetical protein
LKSFGPTTKYAGSSPLSKSVVVRLTVLALTVVRALQRLGLYLVLQREPQSTADVEQQLGPGAAWRLADLLEPAQLKAVQYNFSGVTTSAFSNACMPKATGFLPVEALWGSFSVTSRRGQPQHLPYRHPVGLFADYLNIASNCLLSGNS